MRVIRHHHRLRRISTTALMVGMLLTALSSMLIGAQSASAAVAPAVSATANPYGFPDWYQDANGVRVQPCQYTNAVPSVADPNCILLPDANFNPANPLTFPGPPVNFPGEFFYAVADSDKVTTPGCAAQGWPALAGGSFTRVAVEGSFVTGVPIAGDQITFARIRIVVRPHGLCPNTTYTFTHPYGTETVTTHADGGIPANKSGFTEDIGCLAAPCNTSLPLASRLFQGFVKWDPAVAPAAPAGYLGDGVTLHTIAGSPNTVFQITDPASGVIAGTNLFTVSGKLSGLLPSVRGVDFGGVTTKTTSTNRTVTITNTDATPALFSNFAFTGTNSGDFRLASTPDAGTCLTVYKNKNTALAKDTSCTVNLIFQANAAAGVLETAQLGITYTGAVQSPLVLPLSGTSIASGAVPVVSMSTTSLAFPSTVVKTRSATQSVTISNTGTAPLQATASLAGANPFEFAIVADSCSGLSVAAGASCTVGVRFAPSVSAALSATLSFTDNAAGSPHNVGLTGTGTGGLAAVSTAANAPGLTSYGFPEWYQDENALQLQPCLDVTQPCVLLADPGFNPALPVSATNFPVEFFYSVADSDKMNTPGCPAAGTAPAKTTYRAGLEGSFLTGAVQAGQQSTFTRTRIVVGSGGLCPNKTYAFTTPYGTDLVTTDASGGVVANKKGATIDTGCLAAPCDWTAALDSRVMGGILRWDPSVAPAAPVGFIGDAAGVAGTPHPVIGAPYPDPANGQPANLFRISDAATPGVPLQGCTNALGVVGPCEVRNFTVSGKLASPVSASPKPLVFAAQMVASASLPQVVTLTNNDPAATVTINTASFIGTNSTDYSIAAGTDTCSGATLAAAGGTCTIGVVFAPSVVGPSSAALSVTHTGTDNPVQVPISGKGDPNPNAPVATNDSATTPVGVAATIAVLANDTGTSSLTVAGTSQPVNGSVVVNADNTVTYTPNAAYNGTDSFTYRAVDATGLVSNTATVTIQVGGATTFTSITAPAVLLGANAQATVTVSSAAGTPTGVVSLSVDGGAAVTQALGAGGSSVFTIAGLTLGSHTLTAAYAAQGSFSGSTANGSVLVQAATTTSIVPPTAITSPANGSVTVKVGSASGVPSGTVSLRMDNATTFTQTLVSGSATFTIISPSVGTHTFVATYAAQGNFAGSVSASASLVVNGNATETLKASGTASRNKALTSTSWSLQGTTTVLTSHTMTITLTRTGALIGTATTDTKGNWKLSVTNSVVPLVTDTITVTSSLGASGAFAVSVK